MNPVDHVRLPFIVEIETVMLTLPFSLTEVVIINILVKPRPSHGMQHKVKKQVLLQRGGLGYYGGRRRQRIKEFGVLNHR